MRDADERRSLQLLVVDDDALRQMLISAAAKHAGHAVTLAQSCSEAIKQIQTAQLDCVTSTYALQARPVERAGR